MLIIKLKNLTNEYYIKKNGISSAQYTLNKNKDLQLFELDFVFSENVCDVDDIQDSEWFSCSNVSGIGFWSFDKENPLISLLNIIKNYEESGLNEFPVDSIYDKNLLTWINSIEPELLNKQYSLIEAADTLEHILYVQRKLSELYQQLKNNNLLEPLFDNKYKLYK